MVIFSVSADKARCNVLDALKLLDLRLRVSAESSESYRNGFV